MVSRKLFLSAVSDELGDDRRTLKGVLIGPLLEVKEQTDFINLGGDTLAMLDKYISTCHGVIHLLGDATGSYPDPINIRDLLQRHPDLQERLRFLPDIAANGHRISYTHWEAYLSLYYGIDLYLFRPVAESPRGSKYLPDETRKAEQEQHRRRLEAIKRYGKIYPNADRLSILVLQELVNAHFAPFLTEEAKQRVIPNNLPLVGSLFKGRDEFLDQLRSVLVNKPTHIAAVTAKQAIHGLGGVGKTRVAVEYAKRYSHEYTALLFITADSEANLKSNLANLCGALVLNLPEKEARDQEVQVAAAIRWLREHSGWFLIVDNVDTPEAATAVEEVMQKLDTGHVVITSRLSQWGGAVEALSLDVLTEQDAKDFLFERTAGKRKPTPTDDSDALALAKDLGCLPLALEQAGAFIVEDGCSFADYRKSWKAHDDEVLTWHSHLMKYPRSVATTWQTSFDKVGAEGQALLRILCWLAPEPIPLTMLEKLDSAEGEAAINWKKARRDLARYSFVKWTDDTHTSIVVHRLVQEITEYRLPEEEKLVWLKQSLEMVDEFCNENALDVRSWKGIYTPARPHLFAITQTADLSGIIEPTSRLMSILGLFLKARSELAVAEPLYRRALRNNEASLGPDHPTVATCLNNLAELLRATNRLTEAEPLFRRALAIDEASHGTDHPNVAIRVNNLALLLEATNRLEEAEPLFRRALAIDEARYGSDHPNVAIRLNNLAGLFGKTNRLVEAEPLYQRVLTIYEASFGPDHPKVAIGLNNLAQLLYVTDRSTEAEPLYRRALTINEASYGPDHPIVAIVLNNLGNLLGKTERLAEAEPLMRRHLAIFVLFQLRSGHQHPHLYAAVENYTRLLQEMGRSDAEIQAALASVAAEAQAVGGS